MHAAAARNNICLARACAHARCRVFSGRRGGATSGTVGDPLIVLVEVGELCYLSDPGGNSKLVTSITLARPGLTYGFQTQSRSQPCNRNWRRTCCLRPSLGPVHHPSRTRDGVETCPHNRCLGRPAGLSWKPDLFCCSRGTTPLTQAD